MALHSINIGDNLAFWHTHRRRLVDAFGPDVYKIVEDFANSLVEDPDSLVGTTVTLVEAGVGETTIAGVDFVGGAIRITTDAAENDGANVQWSESFEFTADQRAVYFGMRFQANHATQNDILIGLCITDTDLLGGMTDGVYYRKIDGSAAFEAVTEKDSTETSTASVHTLVADTNVILEFYYVSSTIYFYVNGVLAATHTTNIPDDEILAPSIHFLTGEAVAKTMTIDWLRVIGIGR